MALGRSARMLWYVWRGLWSCVGGGGSEPEEVMSGGSSPPQGRLSDLRLRDVGISAVLLEKGATRKGLEQVPRGTAAPTAAPGGGRWNTLLRRVL